MASPFTIIEFGPMHAIGIPTAAVPGKTDFATLWQKGLFVRSKEIAQPPAPKPLAICRCIPGVTERDNPTFEYIPMMQALPDAVVPAGMIAVDIPRATYAAFHVPSYAEFGRVWGSVNAALAGQTEWKRYCNPEPCQCAQYPSFEYYPSSDGTGYVYIPVHRA
ncbi:MAG TPA: GyrI-like domain-containing protein [Phycisphaerae bacterium]|jgi:predicted transcriptional regulator YdeE